MNWNYVHKWLAEHPNIEELVKGWVPRFQERKQAEKRLEKLRD